MKLVTINNRVYKFKKNRIQEESVKETINSKIYHRLIYFYYRIFCYYGILATLYSKKRVRAVLSSGDKYLFGLKFTTKTVFDGNCIGFPLWGDKFCEIEYWKQFNSDGSFEKINQYNMWRGTNRKYKVFSCRDYSNN